MYLDRCGCVPGWSGGGGHAGQEFHELRQGMPTTTSWGIAAKTFCKMTDGDDPSRITMMGLTAHRFKTIAASRTGFAVLGIAQQQGNRVELEQS